MDSIELLLDERSEHAIRADWTRLQDAGLPSLASHASPTNRPHITLLAAPEIGDKFDVRFDSSVSRLPVNLRFGGLIIFDAGTRRYVLSRQIVCSMTLLKLHSGVHAAVEGLAEISENTLPNLWTPHVTLARALKGGQLAQALELLSIRMPDGSAGAIRRWDSSAKAVVPLGDLI